MDSELALAARTLAACGARPSSLSRPAVEQALETILRLRAPAPKCELFLQLESIHSAVTYFYAIGSAQDALTACAVGVALARQGEAHCWERKLLNASGALNADLGNLPASIEAFSDALDVCDRLADPLLDSTVWCNLAATLVYAQLPDLAIASARKAIQFSEQLPNGAARSNNTANALTNLAVAALHTDRLALGLRSARHASDLFARSAANSAMDVVCHANCLCIFARLLLRVRRNDAARGAIERLSEVLSKGETTPRSRYTEELAKNLYLAYSGHASEAISGLESCLQSVKKISPAWESDCLRGLIEASNIAGNVEASTHYVRTLGRYTRRLRVDDAIFHHHRSHFRRLRDAQGFAPSPGPRQRRLCTTEFDERLEDLDNLAIAAELSDDPSGAHAHRVGELSAKLAQTIGLSAERCAQIRRGARLHDLGKIGVPSEILRKPGPLTQVELEIMRTHTVAGAELISSAWSKGRESAVAIARHHHEWWSGRGYPDGLAGEQIPIDARITSICEAFDAMTNDRVYRPKLSVVGALRVISDRAGIQFDPVLAAIFCSMIRKLLNESPGLEAMLKTPIGYSSLLKAKNRLTDRFEAEN